MEPNFFSLLSKKIATAVIAIGSMFYSTISGVSAEFEDLQIGTRGDQLVLSTGLLNCFSEDLDRLWSSGREIRIYFLVELMETGSDEPESEITFYHSVKYSLIDRIYEVFYSNSGDRFSSISLDRAKEKMAEIREVSVAAASQLTSEARYFLRMTAYMEKIQLPGMEEKLNLMFYWSSIKPTVKSEPFTREIFRQ